jgi:hypothetical protein
VNKDDALSHGSGDGGKEHPALLRKLLLFERRQQPMVPVEVFRSRLIRNALAAGVIITVSLLIGMVGYHWTGTDRATHRGLGWLESLYNASMILTGMGPADQRDPPPRPEMWFATFYAIFAGVVFLVSVGVLLAPVVHRTIHHFNLESEEDEKKS